MTSHSGATLRRAFLLVPLICAALLVTGCASQPPAKRGLTAEQIAALKELGFRQVDEGWELLTDANVLFATGEFKLTPEARSNVERIGRRLAEVDIRRVRVDGHTDAQGSEAFNQKLSEQRAAEVASALVAAGLPVAGVTARGLGKTLPIASNEMPEGRAQNRRVAIVVLED